MSPTWAVQSTLKAGQFADPVKLCKLNNLHAWSAYAVNDDPAQLKGCTNDAVFIDVVRWVASGPICWGVFPGHVDWLLGGVTFNGRIFQDGGPMWGGGLDNDYSFNLAPTDPEGKLTTNLFTKEFGACTDPVKPSCLKFRDRGLHLETWNSESISLFQLPFWKKYMAQVAKNSSVAALVDGKRAIATGLIGLDCAHACHVELHPLFALAVQDAAGPKSEHWSFFAKNWGNGGYCSSAKFEWDTLPQEGKGRFVYKFLIPWKKDAKSFTFNLEAFIHWEGDDGLKPTPASIHSTPGKGIVIKLIMPTPSDHPVWEGELGITWIMDPKAKAAPPPPPPKHSAPPPAEKEDHDKLHEMLIENLTPAQRKALPSLAEPVRPRHDSPHFTVKEVTGPIEAPPKPVDGAKIRVLHDAAQEQRMKAHYEALRKAYGSEAAFRAAAQSIATKLEIPPKQLEDMLRAK